MSYQGFWQGSDLWQYLIRYDGRSLWSTTFLPQRMLDPPGSGSQECCDCVLDAATGKMALQFESFPPYQNLGDSLGNGGDILVVTSDNWIKAIATQDGGHPGELYYFVGPGLGMPGDGRVGGWVIAGPDLGTSWEQCVCWIDQSFNGPYNPIGSLSPAYVRYILADLDVPYLVNGGSPSTQRRSCVVSEHYSGNDPSTATSVERFFYAQWLGKVRWEIWGLPGSQPIDPTLHARAVPFPMGYPGSPPLTPGLMLLDCRSYINWTMGANPQFTVRGAGWPQGVVLP